MKMTEKMNRLREIAESATPGPWTDPDFDDFPGDRGWCVLNGEVGMRQHAVAVTSDVWSPRSEEDARFIATFDPPMVLALLDVAEAAETVMAGVQLDDLLSDAGKSAALHDALDAALDRLREVSA